MAKSIMVLHLDDILPNDSDIMFFSLINMFYIYIVENFSETI